MKKLFLLAAASAVFFTASFSQGVKEIKGRADYKSYLITKYFQNSTVELADITDAIANPETEKFVSRQGQIMGRFTKALIPAPGEYVIQLPVVPTGNYIDLDNNGKKDKGVQLFRLLIGLNFRGDSYLDQLEQTGLSSVLNDAKTGSVKEGTLLVYAPDAGQRFPSGMGKDKKLFTSDDPMTRLLPGYTLARIDSTGRVMLSRNSTETMNTLEEKEKATPDFSKQGILQSYHSLMDLLKERYAYTELRKIDWDKMRARYLPDVTDADNRKDTGDYYIVIKKIVNDMRDAHVQSASYLPAVSGKYMKWWVHRMTGRLGAELTKLSDGRYMVTSVYDSTPAQKAGWVFGTEILAVNGNAIDAHVDTIPINTSKATKESIKLAQTNWALRFPLGTKVTVTYRQPGSAETFTATMVAGEADGNDLTAAKCNCPSQYPQDISYKFLGDGEIGYIQWRSFSELPVNINMYESFLEKMIGRPAMIIDLRGNTGGLLQLMYTMASYLFTADKPAPMHWLDFYNYEEESHDFVKGKGDNKMISSPRPELAYTGKIVVLVDDKSASAGEYFPQYLQTMKRATIIGEYASEGAGGTLSAVTLPGPIPFTFTGGRSFLAGTNILNLEAKGVQPDIRVPVTLENELKKKNCGDPVLDAAIEFLKKGK